MPTEIVLLSEVEPTSAVMVRAAAVDHPDGTFLEYRDGQIRQFVDAQGRALLSIYRSRPVREPAQAADALVRAPTASASSPPQSRRSPRSSGPRPRRRRGRLLVASRGPGRMRAWIFPLPSPSC